MGWKDRKQRVGGEATEKRKRQHARGCDWKVQRTGRSTCAFLTISMFVRLTFGRHLNK